METIKIYIENMFKALPETEAVLRAKSELNAVMEDKYNELKSEGKSENEAIGIVISEFGNIDELTRELNIESTEIINSKNEPVIEIVDKETTERYMKTVGKNAKAISLSVFLILFGVAVMILFGGIDVINYGEEIMAESVISSRIAAGFAIMIIFVIIAVVNIVYNALQLNEFTMFGGGFKLNSDAERIVTEKSKAFTPKKIKYITIGVCGCLVAVLLPIILMIYSDLNKLLAVAGVSTMLILIGAAVIPLIYAGMFMTMYDRLLKVQEKRMRSMKKSERIIEAIAGAYWCSVVAVYLLVSFYFNNWDTSWLIWVVASVVFGGIAAFVSTMVKD